MTGAIRDHSADELVLWAKQFTTVTLSIYNRTSLNSQSPTPRHRTIELPRTLRIDSVSMRSSLTVNQSLCSALDRKFREIWFVLRTVLGIEDSCRRELWSVLAIWRRTGCYFNQLETQLKWPCRRRVWMWCHQRSSRGHWEGRRPQTVCWSMKAEWNRRYPKRRLSIRNTFVGLRCDLLSTRPPRNWSLKKYVVQMTSSAANAAKTSSSLRFYVWQCRVVWQLPNVGF